VFIIEFLSYLLFQALPPAPAPAPTSSAPSVTAAPAQKTPTAPAENVIPPLAAVVQSDASPDPARSTGAESVMPADGLPPLFPVAEKKAFEEEERITKEGDFQ
jgi:hypothetical protein